jgi:hypothetical protein
MLTRYRQFWPWFLGVSLVLAITAVLTLPSFLESRFGPAVRTYIGALREGNVDAAYEMLCGTTRDSVSFDSFRSMVERDSNRIGRIRVVRPLRGEQRAAYHVLEGERQRVLSVISVVMEDGEWRPCPQGGPFGDLRSPP